MFALVPHTELHVIPCPAHVAETAVKQWHYSKRMPSSTVHSYAVWEEGIFIGAITFGLSPTPNFGKEFQLTPASEILELTRVALTDHVCPVSQMLKEAIRQLRYSKPDLKMLTSYADIDQAHHGGLYQVAGWQYIGLVNANSRVGWSVFGKPVHRRTLYGQHGSSGTDAVLNVDQTATQIITAGRHKYVKPLTKWWRKEIAKIVLPYPKPDWGEEDYATVPDDKHPVSQHPDSVEARP